MYRLEHDGLFSANAYQFDDFESACKFVSILLDVMKPNASGEVSVTITFVPDETE